MLPRALVEALTVRVLDVGVWRRRLTLRHADRRERCHGSQSRGGGGEGVVGGALPAEASDDGVEGALQRSGPHVHFLPELWSIHGSEDVHAGSAHLAVMGQPVVPGEFVVSQLIATVRAAGGAGPAVVGPHVLREGAAAAEGLVAPVDGAHQRGGHGRQGGAVLTPHRQVVGRVLFLPRRRDNRGGAREARVAEVLVSLEGGAGVEGEAAGGADVPAGVRVVVAAKQRAKSIYRSDIIS